MVGVRYETRLRVDQPDSQFLGGGDGCRDCLRPSGALAAATRVTPAGQRTPLVGGHPSN